MTKPVIQYQFALDENGSLIDINHLSASDRKDYKCVSCQNTIRPVLGKIRKKHFRHTHNSECSLETYLHQMGKILFDQKYRKCLKENIPYIVEYYSPIFCNHCKHGPCETGEEKLTYDITKSFQEIQVETRDGALIPDLLLNSKSDKIYIEVAVTHKSSNEKINSGIKIIEFVILDESDLEIFNSNKLSMDNDLLEFYNFKPKPIHKNLPKQCKKTVSFFEVYKNGKCNLNTVPIFAFDKLIENKSRYINEITYHSGLTFIEEVQRAFSKGIKVKNCYLCRYHAIAKWSQRGENDDPIFCKYYKKSTNSNNASNCEIYYPDPKAFDKSI